jgi:CBS-domain-containing membrane protein
VNLSEEMRMNELAELTQSIATKKRGIRAIPDGIWAPLATGVLTLIPGLLGLVTGQPWLFPSLGPTAFLQAIEPQHPTSRFYNVLVGHLIGLGAAYLFLWAFQADATPSVLIGKTMYASRLWASVVAIAAMVLVQQLTYSLHPPAAATVLLITLGGFQMNRSSVITLLVGIVIIAIAGELVRRARLMQPGQK